MFKITSSRPELRRRSGYALLPQYHTTMVLLQVGPVFAMFSLPFLLKDRRVGIFGWK